MRLVIPEWMKETAPGAAEAARSIANGTLSNSQLDRLERLTTTTQRAWRETLPNRLEALRQRETPRQSDKHEVAADVKVLVGDDLWRAHHELMWEAFRAPDLHPIGVAEIRHAKDTIMKIKSTAETLAQETEDIGDDVQLLGMWGAFRMNRRDDGYLSRLPDDLPALATALAHTFCLVADFFQEASKHYKPEGPVAPIGHTRSRDAIKTTVIHHIAQTCREHFGATLKTTVAMLANATLDRSDIKRDTVKGSLRRTRRGGDQYGTLPGKRPHRFPESRE